MPFLPLRPADAYNQSVLRAEDIDIVRLLGTTAGHNLVLDLSDVAAPTAGALGKLVALHKRLRDSGGSLVLSHVSPRTYEVLEVTGLTEVLDCRRSEV
jgi:anti-anti-sigma factor